ncbi:hypothetical protein AB0G04_06720 [Actinoplanes sp. NPDC023801]|uniref:hypothetical protein n=1 Tax=Actinoplanes sp. NPDC023801 TaxID=3154595 RepID=UPI0033C48FD9
MTMPFEQYGSANPPGETAPPFSPQAHNDFAESALPVHAGAAYPQGAYNVPPATPTSHVAPEHGGTAVVPVACSASQNGGGAVVPAGYSASQYDGTAVAPAGALYGGAAVAPAGFAASQYGNGAGTAPPTHGGAATAPATHGAPAYAPQAVPTHGLPNQPHTAAYTEQPVYDVHAAQQAQYAQYVQAAAQALPHPHPARPEAVPNPYGAGGPSPYAAIPPVAPSHAAPSGIRKVLPWAAGGVLVLGAVAAAGILALAGDSGPTAAEARTACETAFLDEMNARDARADSSGSGMVVTILNGVEVAEPLAIEGGFEVNGSGKYTMTSMGTSVPGSVALTCTAKHDDNGDLVTTVANRTGGTPS